MPRGMNPNGVFILEAKEPCMTVLVPAILSVYRTLIIGLLVWAITVPDEGR